MIEINLLPPELRSKGRGLNLEKLQLKYLLLAIPLAIGLLICGHIYLAVMNRSKGRQLSLLKDKWQALAPQRKALEDFKGNYAAALTGTQAPQLPDVRQVNWAEKLNKLSLNLPPGIWFNEIVLAEGNFTLRGSVVSLQKEEVNLIKGFIDNLKNDTVFFEDFLSLEFSLAKRRAIGSYEVLDFILSGQLKK